MKPSSRFYWTHSPTTISVNFWLGLLLFSVMMSWFSFCCLKQWFFKPVSKFWHLQNLSTFQIFFFGGSSSAVLACLFVLLVRSDPHKLRFRASGIRNSPIGIVIEPWSSNTLAKLHSVNSVNKHNTENPVSRSHFGYLAYIYQGHPTSIFGKYLFGRRFKI